MFINLTIIVSICMQVIVFCTTGIITSLLFLLLREMKMNVREMHSRKPQLYRTRISNEFREAKRMILVTSDVSARGMNYPDVTLVIQVLLNIGKYTTIFVTKCACTNYFTIQIYSFFKEVKLSSEYPKQINNRLLIQTTLFSFSTLNMRFFKKICCSLSHINIK